MGHVLCTVSSVDFLSNYLSKKVATFCTCVKVCIHNSQIWDRKYIFAFNSATEPLDRKMTTGQNLYEEVNVLKCWKEFLSLSCAFLLTDKAPSKYTFDVYQIKRYHSPTRAQAIQPYTEPEMFTNLSNSLTVEVFFMPQFYGWFFLYKKILRL